MEKFYVEVATGSDVISEWLSEFGGDFEGGNAVVSRTFWNKDSKSIDWQLWNQFSLKLG